MSEEMDPRTKKLVGNFDARIWAEEFVQTVKEHPGIPEDEGCLIGWFANALMAGYDQGHKHGVERGKLDAFRCTRDNPCDKVNDQHIDDYEECFVKSSERYIDLKKVWAENRLANDPVNFLSVGEIVNNKIPDDSVFLNCPECGSPGPECPGTVRNPKGCEWF